MKPIRVQRKRTSGWKMPPNTIYVGRPTKWGNPVKVNEFCTRQEAVDRFEAHLQKEFKLRGPHTFFKALEPLRGKNLACFCPLDQPCHADVLLKLANK